MNEGEIAQRVGDRNSLVAVGRLGAETGPDRRDAGRAVHAQESHRRFKGSVGQEEAVGGGEEPLVGEGDGGAVADFARGGVYGEELGDFSLVAVRILNAVVLRDAVDDRLPPRRCG